MVGQARVLLPGQVHHRLKKSPQLKIQLVSVCIIPLVDIFKYYKHEIYFRIRIFDRSSQVMDPSNYVMDFPRMSRDMG